MAPGFSKVYAAVRIGSNAESTSESRTRWTGSRSAETEVDALEAIAWLGAAAGGTGSRTVTVRRRHGRYGVPDSLALVGDKA